MTGEINLRLIVLCAFSIAMIFCYAQPLRSAATVKFAAEVAFALGSMPANVQTIAVTSLVEEDLNDRDVALLRPEFGEWQIHLLRLLLLLADTRKEDAIPKVCINCVTSGTIDSSTHSNLSCQFLFVDESPSFPDCFAKQTSSAVSYYTDCGYSVVQLTYRKSKDLTSIPPFYYLSRVKSGVVIGTTDRGLLHKVLSRIQGGCSDSNRALPLSLSEWSCVDTGAPFWAIRHFPKSDPTSPIFKKDGNRAFDDKAIGMTFSYRPQEHRLTMNYLSGNSNLDKTARTVFGINSKNNSLFGFIQTNCKPRISTIEVKTVDGEFPHFFFHRLAYWLGD